MELNTKMIGRCELNCTEGLYYCCICCPKKEECRMQCDTLDSYEIAKKMSLLCGGGTERCSIIQ